MQRGVIGIAVSAAAIKRRPVGLVEFSALAESFHQVRVGDVGSAKSHGVGSALRNQRVGLNRAITATEDQHTLERVADLRTEDLGQFRSAGPVGFRDMQVGHASFAEGPGKVQGGGLCFGVSNVVGSKMRRQTHADAVSAYFVDHGIHGFERAAPQRLRCDIDLYVPLHASTPRRDAIEEVVDYDFVRQVVHRAVAAGHIGLQETLGDSILDALLAHPCVVAARVATSKPDVYPDCEAVGVETFRLRPGAAALLSDAQP